MEDFAARENIGFLLSPDSEGEKRLIWVARFSESGGRWKDALRDGGYEILEAGEWVLAGEEGMESGDFAIQAEEWIGAVRQERAYPVEVEWNARAFALRLREESDGVVRGMAGIPEGFRSSILAWQSVVEKVAREIENVSTVRAGIDLEGEAVVGRLVVRVEEGSALATLLGGDHRISLDVAKWLEAEGVGGFAGGFDWEAFRKYFDPLAAEVEESGIFGDLARGLREMVRSSSVGGPERYAGSWDLDEGEPRMVQLSDGRMNEEEWLEAVRGQTGWRRPLAEEESVRLDLEAESVGGYPVHAVRGVGEEEEVLWTVYHARIGGFAISGDDRERFFATAARLAAGEKAERALAEVLRDGGEDVAFRGVVFPAALAERFGLFPGGGAGAAVASFAPLLWDVKTVEGGLEVKSEVPLALAEEVFRWIGVTVGAVSEEDLFAAEVEAEVEVEAALERAGTEAGEEVWTRFLPAEERKGVAGDIRRRIGRIREGGFPVTLEELHNSYAHPEDPEDNAAVFYERAFEAMRTRHQRENPHLPVFGEAERPLEGETLSGEQRRAIAEFLEENAEAIALLAEGAKRRICRFDLDFREGYDMYLDPLGAARQASRLLGLRMLLQTENGEGAEAIETLKTIRSLSHGMQEIPTIMGSLTGWAIAGIGVEAVVDAVSRHEFSVEELRELEAVVDGFLRREAVAVAFGGERAMGIDLFRRFGFGRDSHKFLEELVGTDAEDRIMSAVVAGHLRLSGIWLEDFRYFLEQNEALFEVMRREPREWRESPEWEAWLAQEEHLAERRYLLSTIAGVYPQGILENELRYISRMHAVQIALRLEAARVRDGGYPATLGEVLEEDELWKKRALVSEEEFVYTVSADGFTVDPREERFSPIVVRRGQRQVVK